MTAMCIIRAIQKVLSQKNWSPYVSGVIIGLLQIPVFFIGGSIGASGATGNIACTLTSIFQASNEACFVAPKSFWQLGFVVGIMMGAYLSKKMSKSHRSNISTIWKTLLPNYTLTKRIIYAFSGGYLFMVGARIADGCTSGNGISGVALLSVGSMLVIAVMFVVGIVLAQILYRNDASKKE